MLAWLRPLALAAPLLLMGCILTPGKFTSTLRIDADRSFTFTYVGEVYASDPSESMGTPAPANDDPDSEDARESDAAFILTAQDKPDATEAEKKEAVEVKRRAIAEALSKEAGYRSVKYVGDGKFLIDYRISGTLDHSFVYPFNVDAEAIVPFLAIEVRANDTVRLRAPGFANEAKSSGPMSAMGAPDESHLDGVFTLDTDAEIVSQNNEDGPKTAAGRKTISWRATPLTKDAPSAVLRVKAGAADR